MLGSVVLASASGKTLAKTGCHVGLELGMTAAGAKLRRAHGRLHISSHCPSSTSIVPLVGEDVKGLEDRSSVDCRPPAPHA